MEHTVPEQESFMRSSLVSILALSFALALAAPAPARAQSWPAKPVRIVVPFSPGGVADSSVRAIADRLAVRLGQPVVVDNRPGASGNIGAEQVAKSAPDGYTLLLAYDGTVVVNPHVYAKLGFDTLRDFAPVTKLGDNAVIIVAHPSLPANNVRELIALAKAKPGTLNFGSAGTGSTAHLACEMLNQRAGIDLIHVPYKGGGQAMTDVVGGQIPLVCTAIATAQQFIKAGKLKGIGLSSEKRDPAMPEVPTFVESGLAGFVVNSWVGILAPAQTPRAVIDKLQTEIAAVLQLADVRARYAVLGIDPVGNKPDEYAAQIKADLEAWGPVVKKANVRIE
jgi:tripartite-type tricarboxylate transporter receptor subunit TctC